MADPQDKIPATGATYARAGTVTAIGALGPQVLKPLIHQFDVLAQQIWPAWYFETAVTQNDFEWSTAIVVSSIGAGLIALLLRGRAGLKAQLEGDDDATHA